MNGGKKLWMRVIKAKYGVVPSAWFTKDMPMPYGYNIWRDTMGLKNLLLEVIKLEVGMAVKLSFS